MGEKKCTFEELRTQPMPERRDGEELTEEQDAWRRDLIARGLALTASQTAHFPDALTVFYPRGLDISDPKTFPDTYDDKPVVYIDTPYFPR